MALALIRPTKVIWCGSNRVPDGAYAYPAYEYVSVWLKPHAGWRLRLSGLRICFGVAETTCRMALTLIRPTNMIRCG
jgi:hypothetical protein